MKLTCLNCNHKFIGTATYDKMGWHSCCPICHSSFDVDVPEGNILIAVSNTKESYEKSINLFEQAEITKWRAYQNIHQLKNDWDWISNWNEGKWYFIIDKRLEFPHNTIISGALDEQDIEPIVNHFIQYEKEITKDSFLLIKRDGKLHCQIFNLQEENALFTHASRLYCFSDSDNSTETIEIVSKGKKVHYVGWQPNMVFEYKDEEGNLVWSGQFMNWNH